MARPFVELYINNQKVYFKEPPEIFVTYAHTDLHNPTVVKNSYTKTVTVEGTPENNRIFNDFYDMKRMNNGELFNASRKESFVLYRNGEPMETGYVKLDKVNKKGNRVTYDITLYGGLGQFLYNLQYKEDGEQMKLSDLEYNVDFNFEVNKETIKNAWVKITGVNPNVTDADRYDVINFAPCYNGIPENFTADKVAIDVWSFKANNPRLYEQFTTSKDGYGLINGKWLMAELKKEYDEWQMNCLMSYQQRPVIRFKEIINAVCNPKNNGGYTVSLDEDFFNSENPYYENAWMTLPLLSEVEVEDENAEAEIKQNGDTITVTGVAEGDTITFNFSVGVGCSISNTHKPYSLYTNRVLSSWDGSSESSPTDESTNVARYIQIVAYDKNGKVLGGSPVYSFYSSNFMSDDFYYSPEYKASINRVDGSYIRQTDNTYLFNGKHYNIPVENIEYQSGMYFKIVEKFAYSQAGLTSPNKNELYVSTYYDDDEGGWSTIDVYNISEFYNETSPASKITTTRRKKRVSKKTILNSEKTPCDYFLSYLKMFNLHIWKDMYDDIIYVRTRKNFFTGKVKDIEDLIDRGDSVTIKPLTFDNKWLNFKAEYEQEEKLHKDYRDEYGLDYGIQKVNTNYSFDSSSKDVLENYVFKGAITARKKSKYYTNLYQAFDDDDVYYNPFCLDGFQTFLFKNGDTVEGTYIAPKTTVDFIDLWKEKYYDAFPKPNFCDKDNKATGGANVLLFYNGAASVKDIEGNRTFLQIADDIPEFEQLNDGEPCWIWSMDWDVVNNTMDKLPQFGRYITNESGRITHSWDFGTPKALYIPDYSIDQNSSIYGQYWQPYIRDQYNDNTRVVACKVLLRERVVGDWLQNFYYWDGRYWVLNKITDYNPVSNGTTKCEFISVNDMSNYLS